MSDYAIHYELNGLTITQLTVNYIYSSDSLTIPVVDIRKNKTRLTVNTNEDTIFYVKSLTSDIVIGKHFYLSDAVSQWSQFTNNKYNYRMFNQQNNKTLLHDKTRYYIKIVSRQITKKPLSKLQKNFLANK
jgi:hypothetical protein